MSAQVPIKEAVGLTPSASVNGTDNWGQVGNNTALSMAAIYAMLNLYEEIVDMDQKQSCYNFEIQKDAAQTMYKNAVKAGFQEGLGQCLAGSMTIVGEAGSIAINQTGTKALRDTQKEADELNEKSKPLAKLQEFDRTSDKEGNLVQGFNKNDEAKFNRLRQGNFSKEDTDTQKTLFGTKTKTVYKLHEKNEDTQSAIQYMKTMDQPGYREFRTNLDDQIRHNDLRQNTLNQSIDAMRRSRSFYADLLKGFMNSGGQFATGSTAIKKAEAQASSTIFQTVSQQSNTNANGAVQRETKAGELQAQSIQILNSVQAAQRV